MSDLLSPCCSGPVLEAGDKQAGTDYFECSKCGKPCEPGENILLDDAGMIDPNAEA